MQYLLPRLTRQWQHVDLKEGWVRLEGYETKNGRGREFPLFPRLRSVLEAQYARKRALEKELGILIPWVFFHYGDGRQIKDVRTTWRSAAKRAGLADKRPHDFRRTACRNLERAGVARSVAKALIGHRSDAIYERYCIVDATMLEEGVVKLESFHNGAKHDRKVIPLTQ